MWSVIGTALSFLLNLFGFGKKDERDVERAAGEKLGQQETENTNAQSGMDEVTKAVQARDSTVAADRADPGRLSDPANHAARPYRDGPD